MKTEDLMRQLYSEIIYDKIKNKQTPQTETAEKEQPVFTENQETIAIEQLYFDPSSNLKEMGFLQNVPETREIPTYRGVYGKVVLLAKRVIRKLNRFHLEPVCQQQSAFNTEVTNAVQMIFKNQQHLYSSEKANKREIMRIQTDYDTIRVMMQSIQEIGKQLQDNYNEIQEDTEICRQSANQYVEISSEMNTLDKDITNIKHQHPKLFEEESFSFWDKHTSAQSGEDSIAAYILMTQGKDSKDCTYLDIGANHARDMSNTYYFYQKGARGVLVEANPQLIPELKLYRHGDVILNKCIAPISGQMVDFYLMSGDGLSTMNLSEAEEKIRINSLLNITKIVQTETISINEVIDTYFGIAPDLLSIDVEGIELQIMESLDMAKYRPLIVIIETIPYHKGLQIEQKNQTLIEFMIRNCL